MSQNKVDYSKSLVYKIVCNDTNIKNVYIGSTTSFRDRKYQHKGCCNNENSSKYNYPLYTFIRTNGGWDNWDMVLLDYTPCNTKLELHKIEREYIENIDSNLLLNKSIPSRTDKEYYEDNKERKKEYYENNKDKLKDKRKEYYENNKDKVKEYKTEKINCDICNSVINRGDLSTHKKSKKCLSHINTL